MIDTKKIKGFESVVHNLNPYGHTSLVEVCRKLKELYPDTDLEVEDMEGRGGVRVIVLDGAESIDTALCKYSALNSTPSQVLPEKEYMNEIQSCVDRMEFEEPLDGDETEELAELFLFLLNEVNGNLDKDELVRGYKKWGIESD